MLFMITQVHTPVTCPKDEGGADVFIDGNAKGITVVSVAKSPIQR